MGFENKNVGGRTDDIYSFVLSQRNKIPSTSLVLESESDAAWRCCSQKSFYKPWLYLKDS